MVGGAAAVLAAAAILFVVALVRAHLADESARDLIGATATGVVIFTAILGAFMVPAVRRAARLPGPRVLVDPTVSSVRLGLVLTFVAVVADDLLDDNAGLISSLATLGIAFVLVADRVHRVEHRRCRVFVRPWSGSEVSWFESGERFPHTLTDRRSASGRAALHPVCTEDRRRRLDCRGPGALGPVTAGRRVSSFQAAEISTEQGSRALRAATRAVYAAFIASGFAFASWASRIPQVRDALELGPRNLGLVLLSTAVGSVVALPLAGLVVSRFGAARTIALMSLLLAVGLATVAVGYRSGVAPVVVGLFLVGFGNGTWDVAMNVEGAVVEQRLGYAIMPRFHAGFSVGTVFGALVGSAVVALGLSVTVHLLAVAAVVAVGVPFAVRGFFPAAPPVGRHEPGRRSPLKAWTEPRTLLVGLFVFCMAFTEGTGTDWLGVAMIDGYDAAPAVGALTFAVFLAAMTVCRWLGPGLLDRFGRVPVLRVSALVAAAGLILVVFGGALPVAGVGAALWGLGTALGFPVGMSAAADDPRHSAGRVSVVASIGYVAFLAGPPLIGFLGEHVGTLRGLTATAGLAALGLLISGACRPLDVDEPVPVGEPAPASGC